MLIIKNTEQPGEEVHRERSRRVPSAGVILSSRPCAAPSQKVDEFAKPKLIRSHCLRVFTEPYLHPSQRSDCRSDTENKSVTGSGLGPRSHSQALVLLTLFS